MTVSFEQRKKWARSVVRRVVKDALAAGYQLKVVNGEEQGKILSTSKKVLAAMFAVDEEHLCFYKDGKVKGSVFFVYGNDGWDVICDHSTSLESVLAGATELVDKYAGMDK